MMLRYTLPKILFFATLSFWSISGDILFHSDFECGESYLAANTRPGSKSLKLVWNQRVREWPLSGGKGFIQTNDPSATDSFTYSHRRGLTLLGVHGLARSHPKFSGVKTGNLTEWMTGAALQDLKIPGVQIVAGDETIFGKFSLEKDYARVNHPDGRRLGVNFPGGLDSLFGRVYVKILGFGRDSREMRAVVFSGQKGQIHFPRLLISKGHGESLMAVSLEPVNPIPGATKTFCTHMDRQLEPGKPYCLEYGIRFLNSRRISVAVWVNEKACVERTLEGLGDSTGADYSLSLFPATGVQAFPGRIILDEICVGKKRIGPKPVRPEIHFSNNTFCLNNGPTKGIRAAQWQLSSTNAWLAPEFNSGEMGNKFTCLPFPDVQSFKGTVEGSIRFPGILYAPTRLELGKRQLARMRYRSAGPTWSDWSSPISLTAPFESGRRKELAAQKAPTVQNIRLVSLQSGKEILRPRKSELYGLEVFVDNPKGFSGLLAVDVHLLADPEHALGNFQNRGGRFHHQRSHGVSFSLEKNRAIYVKQPGNGSDLWQSLDGEVGPFSHVSEGFPWLYPEKGLLRCRFRFPKESLIGPWVMRGFAVNKDPLLSEMYSKIISLEEPLSVGRHRDRIRGFGILVVAGLLMLAGLAIIIRAKSHGSRRRGGKRPGEEDDSSQFAGDPILPYHEKVKIAQDFIRENYTKPISLDDIAAAANVSKSWLVRFFREGTGQTVLQFMSELRIDEAKRYLRETGLSVKEIGFRSGFGTTRNFNTSFQKATGRTPKEFREIPS